MPIKQEVQRLYRIEDANLITTAEAKILFMKRDIVKLNEFGITDVLLDEFQLLVKDFEKFSTDLELLGFQAQATEKKVCVYHSI